MAECQPATWPSKKQAETGLRENAESYQCSECLRWHVRARRTDV